MRKKQRLTVAKVAALKAKGLHPDGDGLYLRVTAAGTKSWIFRFTRDGRTHDMGLGRLATVSLIKARELAAEARRQQLDGADAIARFGQKILRQSAIVEDHSDLLDALGEHITSIRARLSGLSEILRLNQVDKCALAEIGDRVSALERDDQKRLDSRIKSFTFSLFANTAGELTLRAQDPQGVDIVPTVTLAKLLSVYAEGRGMIVEAKAMQLKRLMIAIDGLIKTLLPALVLKAVQE